MFLIFYGLRDAVRFIRCGFGYVTFVMVPRSRNLAAHSPCCRASVLPRTRHAAAYSYTAVHPCFRAFVCRRASLVPHVYVLPRTFAYGRAVLCISAHSTCCHARPGSSLCLAVSPRTSHGAAQFDVRPRTHGATRGRTLRHI